MMSTFACFPGKPVLTSNVSSPTDGDPVELTCSTSLHGITNYEFFRSTTSLGKTSSNQHTVGPAAIGTDDGNYTCVTSNDTVTSDASNVYFLSCKLDQVELTFHLLEHFVPHGNQVERTWQKSIRYKKIIITVSNVSASTSDHKHQQCRDLCCLSYRKIGNSRS